MTYAPKKKETKATRKRDRAMLEFGSKDKKKAGNYKDLFKYNGRKMGY